MDLVMISRLISYNLSKQSESRLDEDDVPFITSNMDNPYVPFYIFSFVYEKINIQGQVRPSYQNSGGLLSYIFNYDNKICFFYGKSPTLTHTFLGKPSYNSIISMLRESDPYIRNRKVRNSSLFFDKIPDNPLYISNGLIRDAHNRIFLMLVIENSQKPFHIHGDVKELFPYMKVLVSNEFLLDPQYKNLYRRVNKEYLTPLMELGMRIEYCSEGDVDRYCYNSPIDIKFKTLEEIESHIDTVKRDYAYNAVDEIDRMYNESKVKESMFQGLQHGSLTSRLHGGIDPIDTILYDAPSMIEDNSRSIHVAASGSFSDPSPPTVTSEDLERVLTQAFREQETSPIIYTEDG